MLSVTVIFIIITVVEAQIAPLKTSDECAKEWDLFYETTQGVFRQRDDTVPSGTFLTNLAISAEGYDDILGSPIVYNVIDAIQESPSSMLAISLYNSFVGNRSIEELAKEGSVEPVLTKFTKRSVPVIFKRLQNGTFTATDAVNRTFVVRDTRHLACNSRVLVIDSILLPASRGALVPRFNRSTLEQINAFLSSGLAPAPAPAPLPWFLQDAPYGKAG